jgi:predicted Zn-dependent protease with MMP-like domain
MFRVTPERFDEMVGAALDEIPERLAEAMENVVVTVEEQPSPQQASRTRGLLLGLYEGVPLTKRGPLSYSGVAPDRITIFRGSLCSLARDDADLAARVRVTVLHEVGHYFGMTDERLEEMGWA